MTRRGRRWSGPSRSGKLQESFRTGCLQVAFGRTSLRSESLDDLDSGGAHQDDEDAGEDEQDQGDHDLHGRLGRPLLGELPAPDPHGVGLDAQGRGDAGPEPLGLDQDGGQGAHVVDPGADARGRAARPCAGRPIWTWKLAMASSSQSSGQAAASSPATRRIGGVEAEAGLDADDHQVQRVGQAEEDRLLRLLLDRAQDNRRAGRTRSPPASDDHAERPSGLNPIGVRPAGPPPPEPTSSTRANLITRIDLHGLLAAEAGVEQGQAELAELLLLAAARPCRGGAACSASAWMRSCLRRSGPRRPFRSRRGARSIRSRRSSACDGPVGERDRSPRPPGRWPGRRPKRDERTPVRASWFQTLIATIFLIATAPRTCRTAAAASILVPTGVVNRSADVVGVA